MRKLTWGKATSGQRSQVPWANKYLSTSSIKWHLQAQFTGCKKKKKEKYGKGGKQEMLWIPTSLKVVFNSTFRRCTYNNIGHFDFSNEPNQI